MVAQEPLVLHGLSVTQNEIENCFQIGSGNVTALDVGDLESYCDFVKHMVLPPADDAAVADYVPLDDIMLSLYHRSRARVSKPDFGRKLLENDPYYNKGETYLCYLSLQGECLLTSKPAVYYNYPCRQERVFSSCV